MPQPSVSTSVYVPQNRSLKEFSQAITQAVQSSQDDASLTQQVRALLMQALKGEEFVLDCVEEAQISILQAPLAWSNPPIINNDKLGFSVRLVYWPPRFQNSPHEHTFWTVTGVFSNELTFTTYRRGKENDFEHLEVDRRIEGKFGEVGYILPPCIHSVGNPSPAPSISIHIFSGPKLTVESYERGRTTWYDPAGESRRSSPMFTVSAAVQALLELLETIPNSRALLLLDRMFPVGDRPTRLACAKSIGRRNPVRAGERLLELASQCGQQDAARIEKLARSLLAAAKTT